VTDVITPDQVRRYLVDVDYPADKEELVAAAERAGGAEAVVRGVQAIPPVEYRNRAEVMRWVRVDPGAGRSARPAPNCAGTPVVLRASCSPLRDHWDRTKWMEEM
jgi:hypothetical protein